MEIGKIERKKKASRPDMKERREIVIKLIKEKRGLESIDHFILEMNKEIKQKYPDFAYDSDSHQSTVSNDLAYWGYKSTRGKGIARKAVHLEKDKFNEMKNIISLAKVTPYDIGTAAYQFIIKIDGYGHVLSTVLKKTYTDNIIDVVVLESSLIVLCVSKDARKRIKDDIVSIIKGIAIQPRSK